LYLRNARVRKFLGSIIQGRRSVTRNIAGDACAGALGLGGSRLTFTVRECPAGQVTTVYADGICLGRIVIDGDGGQCVHDPTGRQRDGDDYARLMLRLGAELAVAR
jgi:hypothetical protein